MTKEQKIAIAEALQGKREWRPNPFQEAADVVRILRAYKEDKDKFLDYAAKRNFATPNVDVWYHTTGSYDATKGDPFRGAVTLGAGLMKEIFDLPVYIKNKGFVPALKEFGKDISNDYRGVKESLKTPDISANENKLLKALQTPTMHAIMPEYRSIYGKKGFE